MLSPIELRSDNAAGAAPELLAALTDANSGGAMAYGGDAFTERLQQVAQEVFEHPDAAVFPVGSGTAANALGLSALCPPWGSIVCHETSHIYVNECGAGSLFTGGGVIRGIRGDGFQLHPDDVRRHLDSVNWGDPHHSQPSVLSLTCPTDFGTVYRPAEVSALAAVAREGSLRTHLDGARLANALVANDCTPAALTCGAGIEMLSLGAIKNGAVSTDAIVSFDPAVNEQLTYRLKRSGHVASKMRFQSVQLIAYLTDGLWLRLAERANAAMKVLSDGLRSLGLEFVAEPQANMLFVHVGDEVAQRMADECALHFYTMGNGVVRLVTSFHTTETEAHEAVRRIASVAG
ncbi:MAG TPA: low specificity L-threonine aldolase [Acidimicrobiaceae bacterium]|nr:low specificity L-threonine aldolase [Acidimicrobiaceae bacterium]